jgi:hypothetical protein
MSVIDFSTIIGSLKTSIITTLNVVLPLVMSLLIVFAGATLLMAVGKLAIGWIKKLGSAR